MRHLSIDIETFSSVDIKKSGLYKYVQSPDFEILLFAYAYDNELIELIDLTSQRLPINLLNDLVDPNTIKHAYNASFEWYCLSKWLKLTEPQMFDCLKQWRCTMFHGLYCGFTAGLGATAVAMGMPDDKRKMWQGSALIRTFCIPCKQTAKNGNRNRTLPHHEPDKWELFKDYCIQDVVVEREIARKIKNFPVTDNEQYLWELDQVINAQGVGIDKKLVESALDCSDIIRAELMAEAFQITGLNNPNSAAQLKKWLETETDEAIPDLKKETVTALIKGMDESKVKRILEIRQELSKTSVKKYASMINAVCADNRVRGILQFYGANRTGRWAGRLVQLHNLPRNYLGTLSTAREWVKQRRLDDLKIIYGNIPDTLSQLIRTAFVPQNGKTFVVADFSAIEARVIAWLAGEAWRQEVFSTHGKIYEASAAAMFGVPLEKIKKGNPEYDLRQKGKIAELALGYGGSKGALITMGALTMGLTEDELPDIVFRWRSSNKQIVNLWYAMENAAIQTVKTARATGVKGILFNREYDPKNGIDFLTVTLHSGRKLFYVNPHLAPNKWGNDSIHYYGMDQTTKKWCVMDTYGGKLVENIVQAIARDCLAENIKRLAALGHKITFHVHDEVIIEGSPEDLESVCNIMGIPLPWAPGLLLKAEGFVTDFYKKE